MVAGERARDCLRGRVVTILHVDMEHEAVVTDPVRGTRHRDDIGRFVTRLRAIGDDETSSIPYRSASLDSIMSHAASAVVIGGCTTDWSRYDFGELGDVLAMIRAAPVPILGICAGHQLIGHAHGAAWGPLAALAPGEIDSDPAVAPGRRKERGFLPIVVDRDCPLFRSLEPTPTFFQSHYWQLLDVPPGFVARASSPWSAVQAIEHLNRPVFGVQFHPERFDASHPDGSTILKNFLSVAASVAPSR